VLADRKNKVVVSMLGTTSLWFSKSISISS
jgi:hypothetical protein